MSVLQTVNLSADAVKLRWKEPYVTAGLNAARTAGDAKGVIRGFSVVPNAGFVITVAVDPALNTGFANVRETTGGLFTVTIVQPANVGIDLTAQAGTTVFICLDAQYAVGSNSAAQIKVVDAAELGTNLDLVVLAKVAVPGVGPVLASHINMGYRTSSGDSQPLEQRPPVNAVMNGSFERDFASLPPQTGWQPYTGFGGDDLNPVVDNTVFRTGTQSLKLEPGGVVTSGYVTGPIPVQAGDIARASMWIRSHAGFPIAGGSGVQVFVFWLGYDYDEIATTQVESNFTGGSAVFEQRQAQVTAPAGAAYAQFGVSYSGCSGRLYIDDVEFIVRTADALARSSVFGGSRTVADREHTHSALGLAYAGGPAWHDGTTNPATTVEQQLDKIITDVGGAGGAAKIGYTATTPVDLTTDQVNLALDELDDKKAGLAQPNTFTKPNTFTSSTANTNALIPTGNGTGSGTRSTGGNTAPVSWATNEQGAGVVALGGTNSSGLVGKSGFGINPGSLGLNVRAGVLGIGTGTFGVGVYGVSSADSSTGSFGGVFAGSDGFDTNGVSGLGKGAGHGGVFNGGATGNALRIGTGHAAFIGANPASSTAFTNTATPTSIVKAWARCSFTSGVSSIVAGFNVTSISNTDLVNGIWTLNLASTVAKATRATWAFPNAGPIDTLSVDFGGGTDTTVVFATLAPGGGNRDLTTATTYSYVVLVFGIQ